MSALVYETLHLLFNPLFDRLPVQLIPDVGSDVVELLFIQNKSGCSVEQIDSAWLRYELCMHQA